MLGYQEWQDNTCANGHYMPEASAADHEYAYKGVALRCHACTAIAIAMDQYKESPHTRALMFSARLTKG